MGIAMLQELLVAAGEAPPDRRILLRDPIASFGTDAILVLEGPMWIGDPKYSAFAIRTIQKAGELGSRSEAVAALKRALAGGVGDVQRADIHAALLSLGSSTSPMPKKPARGGSSEIAFTSVGLADLARGHCYRRVDLHSSGLGGNRQKGISYPAGGTYCLLFSDPSKASEYGYHDAPVGTNEFRYFGEWDGSADMSFSGGNRAIIDRSPELYLFTEAACGKVFRGRFECVKWDRERTTRHGIEHRAIVFHLRNLD